MFTQASPCTYGGAQDTAQGLNVPWAPPACPWALWTPLSPFTPSCGYHSPWDPHSHPSQCLSLLPGEVSWGLQPVGTSRLAWGIPSPWPSPGVAETWGCGCLSGPVSCCPGLPWEWAGGRILGALSLAREGRCSLLSSSSGGDTPPGHRRKPTGPSGWDWCQEPSSQRAGSCRMG